MHVRTRLGLGAAAVVLGLVGFTGCMQSPRADSVDGDASPVWNFTRVDLVRSADGIPDRHSFSKLAPWPLADGRTLFSGCYDPVPLIDAPAEDRCFGSVDLSDPNHPTWLATVYTYDRQASPAPPAGHAVWQPDYPFPNLPARAPCRVDWNDPDIAAGRRAPPCWDPGWNTHTHSVALGPGNLLAVNQERYRLTESATTFPTRSAARRRIRWRDCSSAPPSRRANASPGRTPTTWCSDPADRSTWRTAPPDCRSSDTPGRWPRPAPSRRMADSRIRTCHSHSDC